MIAGEVEKEKHVFWWVLCGFVLACEAHDAMTSRLSHDDCTMRRGRIAQ
jgi:hypothetical protein